jgi:hypothetical protein
VTKFRSKAAAMVDSRELRVVYTVSIIEGNGERPSKQRPPCKPLSSLSRFSGVRHCGLYRFSSCRDASVSSRVDGDHQQYSPLMISLTLRA